MSVSKHMEWEAKASPPFCTKRKSALVCTAVVTAVSVTTLSKKRKENKSTLKLVRSPFSAKSP